VKAQDVLLTETQYVVYYAKLLVLQRYKVCYFSSGCFISVRARRVVRDT